MYKEIVIGAGEHQKTIGFLSNGATPLFYKQVFKNDLLQMLTGGGQMEIASDKIPELAFIMAKQAEKADMTKVNYNGFVDWLSQFEPLDLVIKSTEIADVYIGDSMTSVEPKKNGKGKAKG